MNLFRPGPVPPGVTVLRPAWTRFGNDGSGNAFQPEVGPPEGFHAAGFAVPPPETDRESILNEARLAASRLLQEAAEEAEAGQHAAMTQGFEAGHEEGIKAAKAELETLQKQAAVEVDKARVRADSVLQTAQAEAKAIRAEAEVQAQTTLSLARDQVASMLEGARDEQHRRLEAAQTSLVELAVAAATRLVQGHLFVQPSAVVNMVAAGIRRLKDTNCLVRVNPKDLPLLEAQRSILERELGHGLLQLQPDHGLSPGGYVITSPQGQIDGRIDQQAEHLRSALHAALGGSAP